MSMSISILPPDILLMICEEIGLQRDFKTLFDCARAGKHLVGPALRTLYKIPNLALSTAESNEVDISRINTPNQAPTVITKKQHLRYVRHWAMQWRSIILSTFGKTAFPYSLYIKSLDLSDLEKLLEDDVFRINVQAGFFAGELKTFLKVGPRSTPSKSGVIYPQRLDIPEILNRVGDAVIKFVGQSADQNGTIASIEEITGNIKAGVLSSWVGHMSRLKTMTLWDGSILNQSVADSIATHCPQFESLRIWSCRDVDNIVADSEMAGFISGLPPNTLRSFTIISGNDVGPETFLSLNCHRDSLKEINLGCLRPPAITSLHMLQGCSAIEMLELQDDTGSISLEHTQNDVYLGVVEWLKSCKQLKDIKLTNFLSGPSLLTAVCLDDGIKLNSLSLVHYSLVNNRDFHTSLVNQTGLESLELRGDSEDSARDDIQTLISSIAHLKNLTYLNILGISDHFATNDVISLTEHLSKLEELSIGGYDVRDGIWPTISGLHSLRNLSFQAMTTFSFDAIMNYIDTLRPTNAGLLLSVMSASLDSNLTEGQQNAIKKAIEEKVDGRFEFVLFREQDSDFDSDSD